MAEEEVIRDSYFAWLVMLLLPESCYLEFFENFNFLDVPCLKIALSKGLGVGIILGSVLVKIPQIVKIAKSQSAAGISILGTLLELVAISANWAYSYDKGYPFSAWGEALFLAVQTSTIVFLCLLFSSRQTQAFGFVALYASIMWYLLSGLTPMSVLSSLQASNIFMIIFGKLIQALTNYSNGHTGQLSAVTIFLLTAGTYARIFTTIQETGDTLTTWMYIISASANSLILSQVFYYWSATAAATAGKVSPPKGKKQKAKKAH